MPLGDAPHAGEGSPIPRHLWRDDRGGRRTGDRALERLQVSADAVEVALQAVAARNRLAVLCRQQRADTAQLLEGSLELLRRALRVAVGARDARPGLERRRRAEP